MTSIEIVRYDRSGNALDPEVVENPSMETISEQVAAMDRYSKPVLFLCHARDDGNDRDEMIIMGGGGRYCISAQKTDELQLFAYFPEQSRRSMQIWTSNQGFSASCRYIVWDIDLALRIIETWWRSAERNNSVEWRSFEFD